MLMQRLQFIILISLFYCNFSFAQQDSLSQYKGKHQIGLGLVGPVQVLANSMEGRPVWNNAPMRFWYSYQTHSRLYLRAEFNGLISFDLNDRELILSDFLVFDSVPQHDNTIENRINVLDGKKTRIGFNLGFEWIPFQNFRYLSVINGFTFSKNCGEYYTRIQKTYTLANGSGGTQVTGSEYFYRFTELKSKEFGGYSQLRFSYPIHQRIVLSLDAYLYWTWNSYHQTSFLNYQDNNELQSHYTLFETAGKISAGIAFLF